MPYFFVQVPHGTSAETAGQFCQLLDWYLGTKGVRRRCSLHADQPIVTGYVLLDNGTCQTIMGYQPPTVTMCLLRIELADPKAIGQACTAIQRGHILPGMSLKTFEGNVEYLTRVMVDLSIYGFQWITLDDNVYPIRGGAVSRCQLEYIVQQHQIRPVPIDSPEGGNLPPLRILHIDIECPAKPDANGARFPQANRDAITQISAILTELGNDKEPIVSSVLTLGRVAPLHHTRVLEMDTELQLLETFTRLLCTWDPDVLATYNGEAFDFPYILNRIAELNCNGGTDFSRRPGSHVAYKKTTFDSRAYGRKDSTHTDMIGRINFDLLQYFYREVKLRSYTLNSTAQHYLNQTKEDVHHSMLFDLQHGTDADRARLVSYCEKDSRLVWMMMEQQCCLCSYIEMCRVTGVQMETLLLKGQSTKTTSLILRAARPANLYIPTVPDKRIPYQGARVVDPKKGYYEDPISTLDFTSLYPSIMQAHNLCYSTHLLVSAIHWSGLTPEQYEYPEKMDDVEPGKEFVFVKATTRPGLLPTLLTSILSRRKACQALMKTEQDPVRKKVLDKRQLSLKITANSVYGYTSAFALPNTDIARTTTSKGRRMITWSIQLVESRFTKANGYANDAEVIYGDTDSIMVNWGPGTTVEQALALGKEAGKYCTSYYTAPLNLAFECVYYPMLLLKKKKYSALLWTNPKVHDKVQEKGIESVRRDWTLFCTELMTELLEILLFKRDPQQCIAMVHRACADVLQNRVPMHKLIISKGFKKSMDDYRKQKTLPVHIALAERLMQRDPATAPRVGDRISYILVKGLSKVYRNRGWHDIKKGELAEDPIYATRNRLTVDGPAFIAAQLVKPFVRLLNPVLCKNAAELADADGFYEKNPDKTTAYRILFTGQHMNHRIQTPVLSGPMAGFVVRTPTCLHCKTPVARGQATCASCVHLKPAIYMRIRAETNALERSRNAAWTECQRCQGSLHRQVICGNKECNNFYFRDMMNIQLADAQERLLRFDF
jgi:DNA polymerase delta subunit 1